MKKLIINIEDTPPSLEQIAELKAEYSDLNEKCKGRNWLIGFGFFASAFLIIPVWLGNFMAISDWFHEILVSIAPQYGSVIPLFSIFLAFFTPPLLFFLFWIVVVSIKNRDCNKLDDVKSNKSGLAEIHPHNYPEKTKQIVEWARFFPEIKKYIQAIEGRYPINLEYEEFERYAKNGLEQRIKEDDAKEAEAAYKQLVNS